MDDIIYSYYDLIHSMLEKGAPDRHLINANILFLLEPKQMHFVIETDFTYNAEIHLKITEYCSIAASVFRSGIVMPAYTINCCRLRKVLALDCLSKPVIHGSAVFDYTD